MTNAEKYKDKILSQLCKSGNFALNKRTNNISACSEVKCANCLFNTYAFCFEKIVIWLNSEYKEPKVFTKKEKALIRLFPKLKWVAKDKNGKVFGYDTKPLKTNDFWYLPNSYYCNLLALSDCKFSAIKWEDTEPTSRDEILKSH